MPIEKERLMGFPEGWSDIDNMSDGKRGHGLGNSIVPAVAEAILKRINEVI
jgi:site-specific DNA-cytosine methylase